MEILLRPFPPNIFNLSKLKVLNYLSNNSFSGSVPNDISVLRDLEILDLSSNSFEGIIPLELGFLNNLSYYYILIPINWLDRFWRTFIISVIFCVGLNGSFHSLQNSFHSCQPNRALITSYRRKCISPNLPGALLPVFLNCCDCKFSCRLFIYI